MSPDETPQQSAQLSVVLLLIECIRFSLGPLVILFMLRQRARRWHEPYPRHQWFAPLLGTLFWGVAVNLLLFAPPPDSLPL